MIPNIAWKEGLALLPHHFQRSEEASQERLLAHRGEPVSRGYGFSELAFDERMLGDASVLVLSKARGTFPSGVHFDSAWLPAALSRQIPPGLGTQYERLTVFLAMPMVAAGAPALGTGAGAPFLETFLPFPELATGRDVRELGLAVPNLSLRFGHENNDGFLLLAAGQVMRTASGAPGLAPDFVPTVQDIHASPVLAGMLSEVLEALSLRLSGFERQNPASDAAGMRAWLEMLQLRTSQARLEHLRTCQDIHPERLYTELVTLAGALAMTRSVPGFVPGYRHGELSVTLAAVMDWLRAVLSNVTRSSNLVKMMKRDGQVLFGISLGSGALARCRRVYLAVKSELPADRLAGLFAQQAKVAPRSKLQAIILSALQGIEARACAMPPFYLASGHVCLELVPEGGLWPVLVEEGDLGVYAPPALEISEIEFLAEGT